MDEYIILLIEKLALLVAHFSNFTLSAFCSCWVKVSCLFISVLYLIFVKDFIFPLTTQTIWLQNHWSTFLSPNYLPVPLS